MRCSPADLKAFIKFLALAIPGRLDSFASKATIKNRIFVFFSAWPRMSGKTIPKDTRLQVLAYMRSAEFERACPLATKARPKPIADMVDVEMIMSWVWTTCQHFRTNRYRLSFAFETLLAALTSGRPSEFVVPGGAGYYNANTGIRYGWFKLWLLPNTADPYQPHLRMTFTSKDLKGHRDDHSAPKTICFYAEPAETAWGCPIRLFLAHALMDEVFQDVSTIKEIITPLSPCTETHALRYKAGCEETLILRAEQRVDEGWTTSPTQSLRYYSIRNTLKRAGISVGIRRMCSLWSCEKGSNVILTDTITSYCFRHGAGEDFDRRFDSDERRALMAHSTQSHVWVSTTSFAY
jgi:hypothetical protein